MLSHSSLDCSTTFGFGYAWRVHGFNGATSEILNYECIVVESKGDGGIVRQASTDYG